MVNPSTQFSTWAERIPGATAEAHVMTKKPVRIELLNGSIIEIGETPDESRVLRPSRDLIWP